MMISNFLLASHFPHIVPLLKEQWLLLYSCSSMIAFFTVTVEISTQAYVYYRFRRSRNLATTFRKTLPLHLKTNHLLSEKLTNQLVLIHHRVMCLVISFTERKLSREWSKRDEHQFVWWTLMTGRPNHELGFVSIIPRSCKVKQMPL